MGYSDKRMSGGMCARLLQSNRGLFLVTQVVCRGSYAAAPAAAACAIATLLHHSIRTTATANTATANTAGANTTAATAATANAGIVATTAAAATAAAAARERHVHLHHPQHLIAIQHIQILEPPCAVSAAADKQRRFAGTRWPDEAERLPGQQIHRYVFERGSWLARIAEAHVISR